MIRVLMLDLGQTLIDAQRKPFPHVREALAALADFRTADGEALRSCLVSDYTLVPPPLSAAKVRPVFDEFVTLLEGAGLRPFFEPVGRRVTLSTHAGVFKPAAAVFKKALARLRVKAGLDECLFITENKDHVKAVKQTLGMQALQFRSPGVSTYDFEDWSQAPALIAQRIGAATPTNLDAAARGYLASHGVEADEVHADSGPGPWPVTGRRWHPVDLPELGVVHVAVPVKGHVRRGPRGELAAALPPPDAEEVAAASDFARSLAAHGQIASDESSRRGATHAIETGADGLKRLVRKRFSAV